MSRVLYSPFKGYCTPKNSNFEHEKERQNEIDTDGFDLFDWNPVESDNINHKIKSFYDVYNKPLDEEGKDVSMYDNESEIPMNHISTLNKSSNGTEIEVIIETKNNKVLSKKKLREAKKEARNQSKKRTTRNSKKTQNHNEFDGKSDPLKVKILNNIYREILSNYEKNIKTDKKLCQFFDISIYKEDIDDLKDDEWLNDNNISFVYEYLERYQLFKHDKNLVSNSIQLIRPSMVYLLVNTPNPIDLKGVIPPIEKAKFLFLPVNDNDDVSTAVSGSHWSLVVISILDKTAFIFDTMDSANETESKNVVAKISEYLGFKFQIKVVDNTPQQINGSDCGIMITQLTGVLLSRLLDLENLQNNFIDFNVDNLKISAIDGRIFVLGTILNIIKHKLSNTN